MLFLKSFNFGYVVFGNVDVFEGLDIDRDI